MRSQGKIAGYDLRQGPGRCRSHMLLVSCAIFVLTEAACKRAISNATSAPNDVDTPETILVKDPIERCENDLEGLETDASKLSPANPAYSLAIEKMIDRRIECIQLRNQRSQENSAKITGEFPSEIKLKQGGSVCINGPRRAFLMKTDLGFVSDFGGTGLVTNPKAAAVTFPAITGTESLRVSASERLQHLALSFPAKQCKVEKSITTCRGENQLINLVQIVSQPGEARQTRQLWSVAKSVSVTFKPDAATMTIGLAQQNLTQSFDFRVDCPK